MSVTEDPEPQPSNDERTSLRDRLFQPGRLLLVGLVMFGSVSLPALTKSREELATLPRYEIHAETIEVSELPRWVPPQFTERLFARLSDEGPISLLDENLIDRAAGFCREQPWVEQVVQIRRSPPNRLQLELRFRKPVALVKRADDWYAVDVEGTLLPREDISETDQSRLPKVRGSFDGPLGRMGQFWGDARVLAAARIAEPLRSRWETYDLEWIELPPAPQQILSPEDWQFRLVSRSGSYVLWGRPPGSDHPTELTVDQKIGRLDRYINDYGSFGNDATSYLIDIRHWQEITRRPLRFARGDRRRD